MAKNLYKTSDVRSEVKVSIKESVSRIWLTKEWFVEVDENGYARRSDEGTLGCVLQLRTDRSPKERLALKIPRLLADTVKENAYICELTKDEADNVRTAQSDGNDGLLISDLVETNIVALPRETQHSKDKAAQAQHDHIILIQYDKRFRPRLCCINFDHDKLSVYPEAVRPEITAVLTNENWRILQKKSCDSSGIAFSEPVFVVAGRSEGRVGRLEDEMRLDAVERAWFAGLPSITLQWANGTLQEALGTRALGEWHLESFFDLFDRIMSGVVTLHRKRLLHCDIRPANIMASGTLKSPGDYRLGDYGSFSIDKARVSDAPSGHTMIGPGVGNARATPFYSVERRAGVERETADTAVVFRRKDSGNDEYVIRLGWSSELFIKEDGKTIDRDKLVTDKLRKEILESTNGGTDDSVTSSDDNLLSGDRIRLRDYVFEVKRAKSLGAHGLVLVCHSQFAHVLHNKLAVYDREVEEAGRIRIGIEDGTVISLPSYTEYRQWSAATDLYGIGAISLYCLFVTAHQRACPKEDGRDVEAKFSQMLGILESIPYFQSFWEDLSCFAATMERVEIQLKNSVEAKKDPRKFAKTYPVLGKESVQLEQQAIVAVNNIVQSAPHVGLLLESFRNPQPEALVVESPRGGENTAEMTPATNEPEPVQPAGQQINVAGFLLFMHFVMGCLHRQSHLKPTDPVPDTLPFCLNRTEMPTSDVSRLSVTRARVYLARVKDLWKKPEWFDVFCVDEDKISTFDPRSDFNIRLERSGWMKDAKDALSKKTGMGWVGEQGTALVALARKLAGVLERENANPQSSAR